jgi:hypothetical protein
VDSRHIPLRSAYGTAIEEWMWRVPNELEIDVVEWSVREELAFPALAPTGVRVTYRIISLLFATFLVSVAGCASRGDPDAARVATGKSVAVASVAAREVVLQWVGTTVFNNEERRVPMANGEIDREIEKTTVEVLAATNRYSKVVAVSNRAPSPRESLRSVGADYLLLVEPGAGPDSRFHTNQYFRGVGLLQRSMFGSRPEAYGHVAVKLSLIEVSTGKVVAATEEVNSWPSDVVMSPGSTLSQEGMESLQKKLLYRAPGVVAGALEPLGVR